MTYPDSPFRILCEKKYGPLNMGTVIIAQKGLMISFCDKKITYYIKFKLLVNNNCFCI